MPWRVCRVLDFTKHCTGVHSNEEIAKIETGNQLLSLVTKLAADIPMYRGPWGYEKYHPGFVDALSNMIDTVIRQVKAGEVWSAYDEWHRFLNGWDPFLATPLWVQVGTVIVEGPGPTITPSYDPSYSLKPYRHHRQAEKASQLEFEIKKAFRKFIEDLTTYILTQASAQGRSLDIEEVMQEVIRIGEEIDIGPITSQEVFEQYQNLVTQEAMRRFGIKEGA